MSYKLDKPFTKRQKADFIVEFNHNRNLKIFETADYLAALEVYESFENGEIINRKTEYEKELEELSILNEIETLKNEIYDIDLKRIRAVCEPSIRNEETGETWLEYYNAQILELRNQIQTLQERITPNGITNENLPPLDSGQ